MNDGKILASEKITRHEIEYMKQQIELLWEENSSLRSKIKALLILINKPSLTNKINKIE